MTAKLFDKKKRASDYCARKNKKARKYRYSYYKRKLGGYLITKSKK